MRKRLTRAKVPKVSACTPLASRIITFDDKDNNMSLFDPSYSRQLGAKMLRQHLATLRTTAAAASSVGLASNQLGLSIRAVAIHEPRLEGGMVQWLSEEGYSQPDKYSLYHNPTILTGEGLAESEEESISFPFLVFTINRYNNIIFSHLVEGQKRESAVKGQRAWVLQQVCQQLDGVVPLDWRVNHGRISIKAEVVKYFGKSSAIVEEYSKDLKKLFEEYPELIEQPNEVRDWSQVNSILQKEVLSFEGDYLHRIMKHYNK